MMRATITYTRTERKDVVVECATIADLLRALAEAKNQDDRPRVVEIEDDDTGRYYRLRAELLGESTGLHP